jgi:GNAT superfamily N-acetyltransferase
MFARKRTIDDCTARPIFVFRHSEFSAPTTSEPTSRPRVVTTLPRRTLQVLREQGPRATASKVRAAAEIQRVVVYRLQRERVLKRASPVNGVTLKFLTESDIPACLEIQLPYSEEMLAARFRAGDRCVAAWLEERIVGSRWLTTARADVWPLGISFPVRPGIGYAYDAFTAPEVRGRGIGAMVTAALFESASASGATQIINAVIPSNREGQALARGRSEVLGMLSANRLGPWSIVHCRLPPGYLGAPLPIGEPQAVAAAATSA